MSAGIKNRTRRFRAGLRAFVLGPQLLAFLPAITLGSFWLGGEELLVLTAFLFPALVAAAGGFRRRAPDLLGPRDSVTGLPFRDAAVLAIDALLAEGATGARTTSCLALAIDEFDDLEDRLGTAGRDRVTAAVADRLRASVRATDIVVGLGGPGFAIALKGVRRADLESLIQLAARLQKAIADPISLDGSRVYVSASIGFCLPDHSPEPNGEAFVAAAEIALREAAAQGTGSIRAFSPEMKARATARSALSGELELALDRDQIVPWFQPQVETATGTVSGAEALARWQHPERGMISPGEFLPLVEQARLSERLGDRMLHHALAALSMWDRAGVHVPKVSVNYSTDELRNPQIIDKIRWELDRFDLAPERLGIEVLETVIASGSNDTVIRNLWGLSELGCRIELDDFGTGHAAIGNIRRFAVRRIKIDRSFVTRIDSDQDQQNIVSAILTMADRLNLDTVAEGVETVAEHTTLTRLGCRHVQGFGIARPMPADAMIGWLREHATATAAGDAGPVATPHGNGAAAIRSGGKTA